MVLSTSKDVCLSIFVLLCGRLKDRSEGGPANDIKNE